MHHVCKPKRMLTSLLAVVLAGFFVQSALAVSRETTSAKAPLVIPYLSHGIGVDVSLYGGSLSHTADAEQSFDGATTAQAPDAFQRAVDRHKTFVNAMNATAANAGPDAFQRAVNRHDTAQSSLRPDDRAGTLGIGIGKAAVSQSQSTVVRPDDRAGTRGVLAN